jgi:hypothetical protein
VQSLLDAGMTWRNMMTCGFSSSDLACLDYSKLRHLGVTANDLLECRPSLQHVALLNLSVHELGVLGFGSAALLRDGFGATPAGLLALKLSLPDIKKLVGEPVDWKQDLGFINFRAAEMAGWEADALYGSQVFTVAEPPAAVACPATEAPPAAVAPPAAAPAAAVAPATAPVAPGKLVF